MSTYHYTEPREWRIPASVLDANNYSEDFADYATRELVHVIEYSAYQAALAEVERLKEEILLKREPVQMCEPDMSAAYEELAREEPEEKQYRETGI
jgi:aminopeptidase-like protein